jgi:glutaredoxin 3
MVPRVIVYTTESCGYCRMAVAFLEKKGIRPELTDVSGDDEKRKWLVETTGRRTVPQVFINDQPVGGYTDLVALDRSGRLDALLGL